MTTYNTQNPIGSADPRDLYDNAQIIDEYVNSDNATATDRLGVERATLAGIDAATRDAIANAGYIFVDDYSAGIEITAYNQVVRDTNGEFWRASGSTELPYTTTGAGLPEGDAFVTVGDAALRQALADPAQGGGLVHVSTSTGEQSLTDALDLRLVYVDTLSDMVSLDASNGQHVIVKEAYQGAGFGGGHFALEEANTEDADGIEVLAASTGRWIRLSREGDVTIEVGPSGDFDTVSDAVRSGTARHLSFGQSITILLKSGFVWEEQLFINGINLGSWQIISEDAEVTVNGSAIMGSQVSSRYPAITAWNGGTAPQIRFVMVMDTSNSEDTVHLAAYNKGNILVGSPGGLKDAGWANAFASGGGFINLDRRFATGAGAYNVIANEAGASINADKCDLRGAGFIAAYAIRGATIYAGGEGGSGDQLLISCSGQAVVRTRDGGFIDVNNRVLTSTGGPDSDICNADDSSRINMRGSTAVGAPRYAAHGQRGSFIDAQDADLSGAGTAAVEANASEVNVSFADCSGAGDRGIRALNGTVRARGANARMGGSDSNNDFVVQLGGIINAREAIGGYSVTVNDVTPAGIIFAD